jgi:cytochrome c
MSSNGQQDLAEVEKGGMRMRKIAILAVGTAAFVALGTSAFAAGDAAKGEAAFKAKCAICHQIGASAQNAIGPELNGIVGRKAASIENFPTYSPGMKALGEKGHIWTEEHIDQWIANPKAMIPDSLMALTFPGEPDAGERANIIAYLKSAGAQ